MVVRTTRSKTKATTKDCVKYLTIPIFSTSRSYRQTVFDKIPLEIFVGFSAFRSPKDVVGYHATAIESSEITFYDT